MNRTANKQSRSKRSAPKQTRKAGVHTKAAPTKRLAAKKTTPPKKQSSMMAFNKKAHFSTSHHHHHHDHSVFQTFPEGPIITELNDHILTVKFNNPKMLNAMNIAMGEKMVEITKQLKADNGKQVRAVILTGMGRGFSAGGDLEFLKARSLDSPENNTTEMLNFYSRFMSIRSIPVPVIAAINGPAIGAGAAVASLADYRIASSNATIGWTFANLGLHAGMGSTFYLPKITTTPSIATHLLLSGEIIDAGLAKNYGIVNDVVQVDETDVETNNKLVLDGAMSIAKHYTKHSTLASFLMIQNLRQNQDVGLEQALQREAWGQALTYSSDDFKTRLDGMINRKKK